jgi:hypothetical protein
MVTVGELFQSQRITARSNWVTPGGETAYILTPRVDHPKLGMPQVYHPAWSDSVD